MDTYSEKVVNRVSFSFASISIFVMGLAFLAAFPFGEQTQTFVNNYFAAILFFVCIYMNPAIDTGNMMPRWFDTFRRIYYWVALTMLVITLLRGTGLLILGI